MVGILLSTFLKMGIMMAIGFYLAKTGILTKSVVSKLSEVLINVLFTSSIVSSCIRPFEASTGKAVVMMMVVSTIYYFTASLVCQTIFTMLRFPKEKWGPAILCSVYPNTGFVGYPVCESLFGGEGMLYAVSHAIMLNPFMFTWGIRCISGSKGRITWRTFMTPQIIACVVGDIIYFGRISVPSPIADTLSSLASAMTPMAMLVMGAGLVGVSFRSLLGDWRVYPVVALRNILLPAATYLCLLPVKGLPVMAKQIAVLMSAFPSATTNVILTGKYEKDVQYANAATILSMLVSVATITVLVSLPY